MKSLLYHVYELSTGTISSCCFQLYKSSGDVNGYHFIQQLYGSEPVSSWIENLGTGQNRLNSFLVVQKAVDQTACLSDTVRAEAQRGSGGVSRVPPQAGWGAAPAAPPGSPAASSFSGQGRSLRDASLGMARILKYSAPLGKHVRQIANCYVGLLWHRLCLVQLPKHEALTNKCN